jgi:hypothetical protein
MPGIETEDEARARLRELRPTDTFELYPFEHGWVCAKRVIGPGQEGRMGPGLEHLVVEADTGEVYAYGSPGPSAIAQTHSNFRRGWQIRWARRILPPEAPGQRIRIDHRAMITGRGLFMIAVVIEGPDWIRAGDEFHDPATGASIYVSGLEFHVRETPDGLQVGMKVDESAPDVIQPGMVLARAFYH